MGQLHELPLSMVHPNPDQPRQTFDEGSLEELAASLKAYGQLQPIAVRPVADGYIIIAGERRWRAAKIAGWTTIAAIIRDELTEEEAYELSLMENVTHDILLSLMENVMREAMNPIDEAKAYKRLLGMGIDEAEICKRYGWAKGTVNWKVEVLKCRDDIQHLISRRTLSWTQGAQLAKLTLNGQARALRVLTSEKLDTTEFSALCGSIWAQENAVEMFVAAEVKETAEAKQAGRDAQAFIELALRAAGRLDGAHDADIAAGLTGYLGAEQKVEALVTFLQRISKALRKRRGRLLAGSRQGATEDAA